MAIVLFYFRSKKIKYILQQLIASFNHSVSLADPEVDFENLVQVYWKFPDFLKK